MLKERHSFCDHPATMCLHYSAEDYEMMSRLAYLLCPFRYLKMTFKLGWLGLISKWTKKLSAFSSVPDMWKKSWYNVKEDDERLLWSSPAFSDKLPSLARYTEGWLIISDRGLYFGCKRQGIVKLLFRRGKPPLWKWCGGNLVGEAGFLFEEGEKWRIFLPGNEELFRARLFRYELKES